MSGMTFKHVGISAENTKALRSLESEFVRLGFEGEIVNRSLDQNDCLHKWCRVIRDHLKENGANLTEETVKELILLGLGNTKEIKVPGLKAPPGSLERMLLEFLGRAIEYVPAPMQEEARKFLTWAEGEKTILVAMRSSKYKQLPSDLTPAEKKAGLISMNELLCKVEAWAATDLGLDLHADKEDWWEGSKAERATV